MREGSETADLVAGTRVRLEENDTEMASGVEDGGERELEKDGTDGASGDDERGGWLKNLTELSAFEQQPSSDASKAEGDSGNGCLVHDRPLFLGWRFGIRLACMRAKARGSGVEKVAAVVEDALHDLGRGFADNHLISCDESNDGVRALLDELDKFGIDDDGMSVQPGKFNHDVPAFLYGLSAEGG